MELDLLFPVCNYNIAHPGFYLTLLSQLYSVISSCRRQCISVQWPGQNKKAEGSQDGQGPAETRAVRSIHPSEFCGVVQDVNALAHLRLLNWK